ncbi:MAG: PadR family transcriptional regulator [Solirubrobacteraceae bacterium]
MHVRRKKVPMHGMDHDSHSHPHRPHHRGPRGLRHARPGGRHGFGGPGPRGRRAGRGDVRAAILLLLAEEPRNGYALMQEVEQRSDGVWRPSPGSVYPALSLLEDEGLVRVREGGSGRTFELTDAGTAHVEEQREAFGEPWKDAMGDMPKSDRELRDLAVEIVKITMESFGRRGTPEQSAQAATLLAETRRGLYRILAGEQ